MRASSSVRRMSLRSMMRAGESNGAVWAVEAALTAAPDVTVVMIVSRTSSPNSRSRKVVTMEDSSSWSLVPSPKVKRRMPSRQLVLSSPYWSRFVKLQNIGLMSISSAAWRRSTSWRLIRWRLHTAVSMVVVVE